MQSVLASECLNIYAKDGWVDALLEQGSNLSNFFLLPRLSPLASIFSALLLLIISLLVIAATSFDLLHNQLAILIKSQLDIGRILGVLTQLPFYLYLRLFIGH